MVAGAGGLPWIAPFTALWLQATLGILLAYTYTITNGGAAPGGGDASSQPHMGGRHYGR